MYNVKIGERWLVLPSNFSIEWEENNPCFDDGFTVGSVSLPAAVPIRGNEVTLEFVHEFDSPDRKTEYDNVLVHYREEFLFRCKMSILKTNYPLSLTVAFVVTDFFTADGNVNLRNIDYGNYSLGGTDNAALGGAHAKIDGDGLYCFPPMRADGFYDGLAGMPTTVDVNYHNGTVYETAVDFSKPLVPWFSIPKLLKVGLEALGYAVDGDIFDVPELNALKISTMKALEKDQNEHDFSLNLGEVVTGAGVNYRVVWNNIDNVNHPNVASYKIEEELPILFSYQLNIDDIDLATGLLLGQARDYIIQVKVSVWDGFNSSSKVTYHTQNLHYVRGFGNDNIRDLVTFRIDTTAAAVGKYFLLELGGVSVLLDRAPGDPLALNYNSNYGTILSLGNVELSLNNVFVRVRYVGQVGSETFPAYLDVARHMPDMSIAEFMADVRSDFNIRFLFHPTQKAVTIDMNKSHINRPFRVMDGKIADVYESDFQTVGVQYTFTQKLDEAAEELREEKEAELEGRTFLGYFDGVANLPAVELNGYAIDLRANTVYIAVLLDPLTVWGSYSLEWQLSHQVSAATVVGDGDEVKDIATKFEVLQAKVDGGFYYMSYEGVGQSVVLPERTAKGFMLCNFVGQLSPTVQLYTTITNYSFFGDQFNCLTLNYSKDDASSIYSFCWKAWIEFLNTLTPVTVEIVGSALFDGYDFDKFFRFKNEKFVVEKYLKNLGNSGENRIVVDVLKIG